MSEKIAVISMVKNEADIIESFVRYYATFADYIIIADHNSDDGTWEILEKLREEFAFLITDRVFQLGYIQAEVMTSLMNMAAADLKVDWILPMDADEFLLSQGADTVRGALKNCQGNAVLLTWVDHEVVEQQYDRKVFLLNQPCRRKKVPWGLNKVIVKGDCVRESNLRLMTGNHGLETADHERYVVKYSSCNQLLLAHFPFRSLEQYVSKNVIGWLTAVSEYSIHTSNSTHWRKEFIKIANGIRKLPRIDEYYELGALCKQRIELRYANVGYADTLSRVMLLSEKVCNEFAIMKACENAPEIQLFMIIPDDMESFVVTLESLLKQNFKKWRLHLLALNLNDAEVIKSLNSIDDRIRVWDKNAIHQRLTGFVKFLEAGIELYDNHLAVQVTSLMKHESIQVSFSNAEKREGYILIDTDGVNMCSGNVLLDHLVKCQYRIAGGISSFLFRSFPEGCYIENIVKDVSFYVKGIFNTLLPGCYVLVEEKATLRCK